MLNVYYGKNNLFGYLVCKGRVTDTKVICNVYRANCLFAWVAREYSEDKNEKGERLIDTYLWGFFNDMEHLREYLKSGYGDNFVEVVINKKAPKKYIKPLEKIAIYCQIPMTYKDDLNEHIYGGKDND